MNIENKKLKVSVVLLYVLGSLNLLSIIIMFLSYLTGLEPLSFVVDSMSLFYRIRTVFLCFFLILSAYYISKKSVTGIIFLSLYLAIAIIPRVVNSIIQKRLLNIHPINLVNYLVITIIFIYLLFLYKNKEFK